MSYSLENLKKKEGFVCFGPVSKDEIEQAEKQLGLVFAKEYRDYLGEMGVFSIMGHEFTGICKSKRLNVIDVTATEKRNNPLVPNHLYAVEQTNMDGIVIWQDASGAVYQTSPGTEPIKICDSLQEYIEM